MSSVITFRGARMLSKRNETSYTFRNARHCTPERNAKLADPTAGAFEILMRPLSAQNCQFDVDRVFQSECYASYVVAQVI